MSGGAYLALGFPRGSSDPKALCKRTFKSKPSRRFPSSEFRVNKSQAIINPPAPPGRKIISSKTLGSQNTAFACESPIRIARLSRLPTGWHHCHPCLDCTTGHHRIGPIRFENHEVDLRCEFRRCVMNKVLLSCNLLPWRLDLR